MILQVDQLHAYSEFSLDFDAQECEFPLDIGRLTTPIHFEAQIRKVGNEIVIEGRVSSSIEMNCARCLRPYTEHFEEAFELSCLPLPEEIENVDEIELDKADLDIMYYTGEEISLTQLVREQLLLLIPVKPLCKEDCAGLCPTCGKNLNEGPCSCPRAIGDPRFAVLQKLLHSEHTEQKS